MCGAATLPGWNFCRTTAPLLASASPPLRRLRPNPQYSPPAHVTASLIPPSSYQFATHSCSHCSPFFLVLLSIRICKSRPHVQLHARRIVKLFHLDTCCINCRSIGSLLWISVGMSGARRKASPPPHTLCRHFVSNWPPPIDDIAGQRYGSAVCALSEWPVQHTRCPRVQRVDAALRHWPGL